MLKAANGGHLSKAACVSKRRSLDSVFQIGFNIYSCFVSNDFPPD